MRIKLASFKAIKNYPGYFISKEGRILSFRQYQSNLGTPHFIQPEITSNGYYRYALYQYNKKHRIQAHRLVLETYNNPRPDGMQCRHLNGNKQDNRLENLCWGTGKENEKKA